MYRCVSLQGRNSLRPAAEAAQHNSTSTFFSKTNVFTCSRSAHHPALPHHQMAGVWCCSRPGLTTGGGQKEQTLSLTLRLCYRDHPGKIAGSSAVRNGMLQSSKKPATPPWHAAEPTACCRELSSSLPDIPRGTPKPQAPHLLPVQEV